MVSAAAITARSIVSARASHQRAWCGRLKWPSCRRAAARTRGPGGGFAVTKAQKGGDTERIAAPALYRSSSRKAARLSGAISALVIGR